MGSLIMCTRSRSLAGKQHGKKGMMCSAHLLMHHRLLDTLLFLRVELLSLLSKQPR